MTLPETQSFIHALSEQFLANEEQLVLQNIASLMDQASQVRAKQLSKMEMQHKALLKKLESVKLSLTQAEQEYLSQDYQRAAHELSQQESALEQELADVNAKNLLLEKACEKLSLH